MGPEERRSAGRYLQPLSYPPLFSSQEGRKTLIILHFMCFRWASVLPVRRCWISSWDSVVFYLIPGSRTIHIFGQRVLAAGKLKGLWNFLVVTKMEWNIHSLHASYRINPVSDMIFYWIPKKKMDWIKIQKGKPIIEKNLSFSKPQVIFFMS